MGLGLCVLKKPVPVVRGVPIALSTVFRRMLPFGGALALGSLGFATIIAFITLYFSDHHWSGAAYALTAFGTSFASVRIFFSGAIRKFGGYRCSLISFVVEFFGLGILWLAPSPWVAICGAMLTGFGLSLIFPASGGGSAEDRAGLQSRGRDCRLYRVSRTSPSARPARSPAL